MQREGVDPEAMEMSDFLCDFCTSPWTEDRPMVEGHRGACICGNCLTIAFAELALHKVGVEVGEDEACVLCLEAGREDLHYRSLVREAAIACRRCIKQAAGALHKDKDIDWRKPVLEPSDPEGS